MNRSQKEILPWLLTIWENMKQKIVHCVHTSLYYYYFDVSEMEGEPPWKKERTDAASTLTSYASNSRSNPTSQKEGGQKDQLSISTSGRQTAVDSHWASDQS